MLGADIGMYIDRGVATIGLSSKSSLIIYVFH